MTDRLPFEFPPRVCVVCGRAAPARCHANDPRLPRIVSLNVTIYDRPAAKQAHLATAKAVQVCRACLMLAVSPAGDGTEGYLLAKRLLARIGERYSVMCGAKSA